MVTCIRSPFEAVAAGIALHYARHPVEPDAGFADFHIAIRPPKGLRALIRPQVFFHFEEFEAFKPLPADQAFPMFEWGMNWCVANRCHWNLVIHAAVIERGGRAVVMPAPSGSGKSTLCAGLVNRGWRLLSDELALIHPQTMSLTPLVRPISLKNTSIGVMREFVPEGTFGSVVRDTTKGDIAHMSPPRESVARMGEQAMPAWVVLPRFMAGAAATMQPMPKARAFMHLLGQAFNYNVLSRGGFDALGTLVDRCDAYEFTYSRLEDAVAAFEELGGGLVGASP